MSWFLTVLAFVQVVVAAITVWSVRRQLRTTAPPSPHEVPPISDGHLPTVTVAVPARNEDAQLEACLTSILSSNYSKLEVLALDDHSEDRTPEIIRNFAQSGVRFLQGPDLQGSWLPKNQAYGELAAAANGEYILFCGSDVRLAPQSLRRLVALMAYKHKTMVTILPQNMAQRRLPVLQAMRYYWEMAPPRRLFRRPPVLSSCWIIKRSELEKAGGFEAVRRSVTPEAYFARYAIEHQDGYSFIRSDSQNDDGSGISITSEKTAANQKETAIYTRFPQLHRRPLLVIGLTLAELILLLGPFAVIVASIVLGEWLIAAAAALAAIAHVLAFGAIQRAVFPRVSLWQTWPAFLLTVAADMFFLNVSMYRYSFSKVYWQGREVTSTSRATASSAQKP